MLSPARYFPIRYRRYEISPGLFPLGTDFGGGQADARVFQIDTQFPDYRANKEWCRAERFSKYVCYADYNTATRTAVARWMVERLTSEYPEYFIWRDESDESGILHCYLTGDSLGFDTTMNLQLGNHDYRDAFDALCCQIQEDVAIVRRDETQQDWVAALHLCAPSRWAAEDKIGTDFGQTHAPVPHFEKIGAASRPLLHSVVTRAPQVRFAWSLSFDDCLNDHPEPPPAYPRLPWNSDSDPFFLRVERQTLWGLPDVDAFVFTIRVYLYALNGPQITDAQRVALADAMRSMSPESRTYKGLSEHFDAMLLRLVSKG